VRGAKALLGSMISVKPLVELRNGEIVEAGRQRTRLKAMTACADAAKADAPLTRLGVAHGNAVDVDQMVALLADIKVEHPVVVTNMGAVVGTHGGPGIIGLGWIKE
jgi:fatty acid-binding protein DegV